MLSPLLRGIGSPMSPPRPGFHQPRAAWRVRRISPCLSRNDNCKSKADPDLKALQTTPGSVAEPPSDAKVGAGKAASGLRFPPRLQLRLGRGARSRWEATAPRPPESADNLEITRRHPPGREVGGGSFSRLIRKSNPCFLLTLPPCPPPGDAKGASPPGRCQAPCRRFRQHLRDSWAKGRLPPLALP